MTEVIPRNQHRVTFNCPENLLDQFIYDNTRFVLHLSETDRIDKYNASLKVNGHLKGVTVDLLWDCLASKRPFIELQRKKSGRGTAVRGTNKILVLNLAELAPVVQIFDELGINSLDDHVEERPLWSLASISPSLFDNVPIEFSMSDKLSEIQAQVLGVRTVETKEIPTQIQTTLRGYQVMACMARKTSSHAPQRILADDMGLGKTVQAITAITQYNEDYPKAISLVVCPTSLVYNWKEEFTKFNPRYGLYQSTARRFNVRNYWKALRILTLLSLAIAYCRRTSISIKQSILATPFLDEAQHIKNRGTRNAKSVKMVQAHHRLILTGTPIENSLEEFVEPFRLLVARLAKHLRPLCRKVCP